ncbi:unnamed protein product [Bursaphelenchus okinawaensis]|uniref:Density-regulated protein n=1 Tax=Bursaphelenchus okinawaensis TaxID=465554 RepID=A0A811LDS8_9BILA|nr:unnamed protein product [Bursaphelenchus okinawaensis]CAG9121182.1 unnamed protein product [Bursaphelenchus okinawaensis]
MTDSNEATEVLNAEEPTPAVPGAKEGVTYPLKVVYCGECTLPMEYCAFGGRSAKCKEWLDKNLSDLASEGITINDDDGDAKDEKKHQKRGGKGTAKPVKEQKNQQITLQRAPRGKNKSVTVVKGLSTFGIDLKPASKYFAGKFACGSSVTGADEIVIQGDVKDELLDIIPEKWKEVPEEAILDLGDQKR